MMNSKKVIAIIPARGGSKGLPGKNIRPLCGKPLIAWSIEKALKSHAIDRVLVTTDSEDIAAVARACGAEVPFLRPTHLASDTATSFDVVDHALAWCRSHGDEFAYTALLEPTSPLREDDDIDRMLTALDESAADWDSIVSVGEVHEHPSIMKRLVGKGMEPFCPELVQTTRRQENAPAYFPYGVGYVLKTAALLEEKAFYTRRCLHYLIQRYQNYEIDDMYDFHCVESVMRHQWGLS